MTGDRFLESILLVAMGDLPPGFLLVATGALLLRLLGSGAVPKAAAVWLLLLGMAPVLLLLLLQIPSWVVAT